jgi:hypothetical protein
LGGAVYECGLGRKQAEDFDSDWQGIVNKNRGEYVDFRYSQKKARLAPSPSTPPPLIPPTRLPTRNRPI